MTRALASLAAVALAGCATTVNGPARLAGQELDAAVALYGNWADEIESQGRPLYIWRRSLIVEDVPYVCELRVELGFRRTIRRAYLQGAADACKLYAVRYEAVTR